MEILIHFKCSYIRSASVYNRYLKDKHQQQIDRAKTDLTFVAANTKRIVMSQSEIQNQKMKFFIKLQKYKKYKKSKIILLFIEAPLPPPPQPSRLCK